MTSYMSRNVILPLVDADVLQCEMRQDVQTHSRPSINTASIWGGVPEVEVVSEMTASIIVTAGRQGMEQLQMIWRDSLPFDLVMDGVNYTLRPRKISCISQNGSELVDIEAAVIGLADARHPPAYQAPAKPAHKPISALNPSPPIRAIDLDDEK